MEAALRALFPSARLVGDKYPNYIYHLDAIVESDGILPLVIYRDGRDVVSSTLDNVRTLWAGQRWVKSVQTAEEVARQWVEAMAIMERQAARCHRIRYEDLVRKPRPVLAELGRWLDVDPSAFPRRRIHDTSIGKYRQNLSADDLAAVTRIAGPALERLGYVL
ncbi:MAG: hypothetical protein BWY73_01658 [candidate division TA06 bacterium ADurb.Bin417]|uniref:Sulfotransferase domain protein n=1 Tax=candidate division TA06 bacterium ADurb.Bin417 TaxID=1852828 RepID=A0A1V5M5G6_UNCT6|nr:MAG: hypothetical protein BWY73_01658 [candidate division TA06 bacterium ADurb.Bin417]